MRTCAIILAMDIEDKHQGSMPVEVDDLPSEPTERPALEAPGVCEHTPVDWGCAEPFMVVRSPRKKAVFDVCDKCLAIYCLSIEDMGD